MSDSLFPEQPPQSSGDPGWFTAHCDGGSRGNPGPAGYGAVIEDPQGSVVARLSEYLGRQTNNYAEYQGLLAVLAWAGEHGVSRLRVISDSELMVRQMMGRYKVASPALRPLWEEAMRRVSRLDAFEMRHTLRGGNQEADRLANEAMDRGSRRGSPGGTGPAPHQAGTPRQSGRGTASAPAMPPRKVLDGYVKDGVVHLLDGELPEGAFVKVTFELKKI